MSLRIIVNLDLICSLGLIIRGQGFSLFKNLQFHSYIHIALISPGCDLWQTEWIVFKNSSYISVQYAKDVNNIILVYVEAYS